MRSRARSSCSTYFNDYFGVKYPLPKLDLIAVPGGFGGAMENWGGITFFESRLLFDPATNRGHARGAASSASSPTRWRINGSAISSPWAGGTISGSTRALPAGCRTRRPEQLLSAMADLAQRLRPEAVRRWRSTRGAPRIRSSTPVADDSEAMTAFDAITYNKGQALIRMLENYLGEGAFRDGIRQLHGRACLRQCDHRRSLAGAGSVDRQEGRREIAASFTEQEGVPLVVAETACDGDGQKLSLRQDRFASCRRAPM